MRKNIIAAVVVTYNRCQLLLRCLNAICNQDYKPQKVFVIDNASTDDTPKVIECKGYLDGNINEIDFEYIRLTENIGGAGGFYTGMKKAFEEGVFEAVWMMDDDGCPKENCLKLLVEQLKDYDYIAPIVLSDKDHTTSASYPQYDYGYFKSQAKQGIIRDMASPFNGILYSCRLIEEIGYPKKELFIWGDELDYHQRAEAVGYHPITVIDAIHYHPINLQTNIVFENKHLTITNSRWRLYCFLRNRVYLTRKKHGFVRAAKRCAQFLWSYKRLFDAYPTMITMKPMLYDSYWCGLFGVFSHLKRYKDAGADKIWDVMPE